MAVTVVVEEQPRIPIRLPKLEGLLTEAGGRTRRENVDYVVVRRFGSRHPAYVGENIELGGYFITHG